MDDDRWWRRHGGVTDGLLQVLPMILGVSAFGIVFGIAARQAGLSWPETLGMSVLVFSGAAQAAILSLWPGLATDPWQLAVVGSVVLALCLRFTAMGATLRPLWQGRDARHAYLASFLLVDESWAIGFKEAQSPQPRLGVFLGAGIPLYLAWVASTVIGRWQDTSGFAPRSLALDFIIPGYLLVLLSGTARRSDALPCVVAAVAAWLLAPQGSAVALLGAAAAGCATSLLAKGQP